ncbi:endonuclease V isoform X4 [Camellia sinensis]|uniref:endonuclease V isoform X4 n=1 Tax=Camellia sinensis TaxID=4442 RepID=UPI0010360102|nr:endonuclease V isoform X4 [Camellia sinensis]
MERDPCDGKEASPAETSWSPEIPNHWIEAQDSLKRSLVTEDDFTWKLPRDTNTATASALGGGEVCRVLKYVGGVDISFSKVDPSIACGTLVVLDLLTLEVVYDDFSVVRLHIPYVPGFLAFREAPILLELLEKMKNCAHPFYPQLLMVDGNGLLHPRGFGLACHLGVLANLPTIGIGKNLHHVDGLSQSRVRQLLEAKGNLPEDIITLSGDSGSIWGAVRDLLRAVASFQELVKSIGIFILALSFLFALFTPRPPQLLANITLEATRSNF